MSIEAMKQALEALECIESPLHVWEINKIGGAMNALREAIEQAEGMPEQYLMVGRFMLQPHQKNGYWLTDTGTSEGMQVFQPEMEKLIKDLWRRL
jgi:hypothetical protein